MTMTACALLLVAGATGCRGCGRARPSLFDGGKSEPAEVDPGTLSPDLRIEEGDEPSAPATTPKVSQERTPRWGSRASYAPSMSEVDAEKLYKELVATVAPAKGSEMGVLACHFETTARVKTGISGLLLGVTSAPTLKVELELGDQRITHEGPRESAFVSFTAPLVELGPKSVFVAEAMGTKIPVAATPRGTFEGKRGDHAISCALLPHAEAEKRLIAALPKVTRALRDVAIDAHLVDDKKRGFGQPVLVDEISGKTSSLAALVGWADPRVLKRTEWGERIVRHHRARVLERVDKWPTGPSELEGVGAFAPAQTFAPCSAEELRAAGSLVVEIFRPKEPCAVRVALVHGEGAPFVADVFFKRTTPEVQGELVLDDGEVLLGVWTLPEGASFVPVAGESNQRKLEAGKTAYLHVGFADAFDHRDMRGRPRALLLRSGAQVVPVPVTVGAVDAGSD